MPPSRKPGAFRAAGGVALAAAGVRLAYLLSTAGNPFFRHPVLDAAYYQEWAFRLAASGFHFFADYQGNPLYPYFLALLIRLLRAGPLLLRIVQHGLGVATCLLILHSGTVLLGRKTGILAALIYAFYVPAVFYEGWLLPASLTAFLAAAFLAALLEADRVKKSWGWIGAGAFGGLLTLTRPTLLPVGGLVWLLAASRGLPRRRAGALGLLAGLVLVLAPATLYLGRGWGGTISLSPHGGANFYIGNHPEAPGYSRIPPFARGSPALQHEDFRREAERRTGRSLTPVESSRFWFREGVGFIAASPLRFLRLAVLKVYYFFSSTSFADNYHLPFFRSFFPLLRFPLNFHLLSTLGLLGVFTGWKKRRELSLLYLLTLSYLSSIAFFFVTDRFRLPAAPFFALFAAAAASAFYRAARRRQAARALPIALLGAVLWFGLDRLPETPSPASSLLSAGEVFLRDGRYREAVAFLEEARGYPDPGGDAAYRIELARGEAYLGTGETGQAGEIFSRLAGEYRGELRDPEFDIANAYAARQYYGEAAGHYLEALEKNPGNYRAWNNLGLVYVREGNPGEARAAFEEAREINPAHVPALVNLGNLLAREEDYAGALELFREALRLDPGRTELHAAAAFCLQQLNRPGEAAEELRRFRRSGGRLPPTG